MYDAISTILGVIMGMIIMLSIVWVAYAGNFFVFSYCATVTPYCMESDYINEVDEAIKKGFKKEDILFIKNNELYFKRPKKTRQCVPTHDRTLKLDKPETCIFRIDGNEYVGNQIFMGSSIYRVFVEGKEFKIPTSESCKPIEIAENGYPSIYNY